MVNLRINNKPVEVENGTTILEAAKKVGIKIPTLCYLKGLNEIGACGACIVEVRGEEKLFTSCNHAAEEGMEVFTNTKKVQDARKTNIELILSQHNDSCPTCVRSGNCSLQKISHDLNIIGNPFPKDLIPKRWNSNFPIVRDESKCIKCMRCIQVCEKIQGVNIWEVQNTGKRTTIGVSGNISIDESKCTACGQCITHCPTGALLARDDTRKVIDAINDPDVITVVQVAPAVRAAWGEGLGLDKKFATEKRMAAALRAAGIDYVFDTNWSADLTIMEEGSEFLARLSNKHSSKFPMFTSCCPGWVRFVKSQYPEFVDNLSTAKSPQQMFGAVAKSYFPEVMGLDPKKIFSISVMPCTAKKTECEHDVFSDAGAGHDVDVSITTRELDRMLKELMVDVNNLDEEEFDSPLGTYSGAGVIFGVTGGVMEAALRSAYYLVTGSNPDPDAFKAVRGMKDWKEASFEINGIPVRTATVHGLANVRKLLDAIKDGSVDYDFVEVMACPGGCVGGGGQPIHDGEEMAEERSHCLYDLDRSSKTRFSHENPEVQKLYEKYLEKPLSHKAHTLLHTNHHAWKMPGEE